MAEVVELRKSFGLECSAFRKRQENHKWTPIQLVQIDKYNLSGPRK